MARLDGVRRTRLRFMAITSPLKNSSVRRDHVAENESPLQQSCLILDTNHAEISTVARYL